MPDEAPLPSYYVTALDRVGLAILAGAGLSGMAAVPLVIASGARSIAALLLAWVTGAILAGVFIVVAAMPAWILLHRRGLRGPGAAAIAAAALATVAATAVQLWGTDRDGYRWASALATSVPLALAAAAIGLVMQRVAYRRLL